MATQIRPNRLEVSDRFPMLGFTVRTDGSAKRFEIAIGTSPELFGPDGKARRNRDNFFSTRAAGPLAMERGESVYVVPPEVLARFVGQQKLYYGLAMFSNGTAAGADIATMPGMGSPYINLAGLTGRSLQRVRLLPSRQRAASGYGKAGSEMDWAGDAIAPGTQPASLPGPKNGTPGAIPGTGPSTSPQPQPAHYDDGYGPLPVPPAPVPAATKQQPQAASLSDEIPLDPGIGGQSIGTSALQIGDIILSTSGHLTSTVIRVGSGSQVSHALMYVGQGDQVVEAVGGGVRLLPLADAINDATVAVAFRVPELTGDKRQQIADSIAAYLGHDYDYVGLVKQGLFQIHKGVCSVLPDASRQNCENWFGKIDLGRGSDTNFFCSSLITQAYANAGVPITARPPNWNSPQDIADIAFRDGALQYVGHLKAPIPSKSLLDVFGLSMAASLQPTNVRRHRGLAHEQGVLDVIADVVLPPGFKEILEASSATIREGFRSKAKRYAFPSIRTASSAETATINKALERSPLSGVLDSIFKLLEQEYSVGIGIMGEAGIDVIGGGAGVGIVLTTHGHAGVYGQLRVSEGMFAGASLSFKITIVKGGVERFNEPSLSLSLGLFIEVGGEIEILGNERGDFIGVAVALGVGAEVEAKFSQEVGKAVQLLAKETVPARMMSVRAMDSDLQPAQLPAARKLTGWEKTVVRGALDVALATSALPISGVLPQLVRMVNEQGFSVGIGLGGDAGLLGGAGAGFGVILAPDSEIGVFGSVEIRAGLLAGLSAGARVIVVHGGIETFNETGYSVGVTIEDGPSGSVLALFNANRQFHGVSFQLGVGAALSPIQIFTATEKSVSATITQSLSDDPDAEYGIDGPVPDGLTVAQSLARSFARTPEYPQASRFEPANTSNYRAVSGTRTINRIVIHITDGGSKVDGTISWFKDKSAKVSSHYIVGQDGEVVQMVKHNDVAWHAHTANGDSIGIEHVANTKGLNPTPAQYCASAALANWLCSQFSIPMDRIHIVGHSEADPKTTHTGCPNAVWDWSYYTGMVTSATCYDPPSQSQSLSVRLPAPPSRKARGQALDTNSRLIGNSALNSVTGGDGKVTWELDQFPGVKIASSAAVAPMQSSETIQLSNWPYCDHANGTRTSAWFTVDWKFSGQMLGDVRIAPSGTQQGAQPLRVEARIEEGKNKDTSTVSLMVRFTYHFSTGDGPEVVAVTELTLWSDGSLDQKSNWTAQAAG